MALELIMLNNMSEMSRQYGLSYSFSIKFELFCTICLILYNA